MPLEFSAQSKARVEKALAQYPNKQAALLPVLHIAQDEFGHLPDDVLELVAKTLELAPAHVFGVITFYTMFHREKHGRNELMVCTNVSCMLRGSDDILRVIEERLKVGLGQTTTDGKFSFDEVECLASCGTAPCLQINEDHHENLTREKVDALLEKLS